MSERLTQAFLAIGLLGLAALLSPKPCAAVPARSALPDLRPESLNAHCAIKDPRRDLEKALKARDAKAAEAALRGLLERPDAPTFTHALRAFEARFDEPTKLRLRIFQIGDEILALQEEIAELNRRKSSSGASVDDEIAEIQAKVAKKTEERVEVGKTLTQEFALRKVLRIGLGRMMRGLDENVQRDLARRLKSRFRATRVPEDRRELLGLLVWNDDPESTDLFLRLFETGEVPDRVAALVVLGDRGGQRAMEPALRGLVDAAWTVRSAAIELLTHLGGRVAVQALIERLEKEDGRIRSEVATALRTLTNANFFNNVHLWREWFEQNGNSLGAPKSFDEATGGRRPAPEPPPITTAAGGGRGFYGIEADSKNPIFVLDFSGSMTALTNEEARPKDATPHSGIVDPKGYRRIDAVGRQLLRAVQGLSTGSTFNVVVFESDVRVWRPTMQVANQANRSALEAWLYEQRPGGSTNLFGGLERALQIAGRGSFDKHYELVADTIFLLSDGAPSSGRLVQTEDILREMRELNELRRIAIHAISIGSNSRFLQTLAREHHGQYVFVR